MANSKLCTKGCFQQFDIILDVEGSLEKLTAYLYQNT